MKGYPYYLIEDPETGFFTDLADNPEGPKVSRLNFVHSQMACAYRHCAIHGTASIHPLSMEPLIWDDDYQTVQRLCAHGIKHPDKDNVDYFEEIGGFPYVHNQCDGCCTEEGYKTK